MCLKLLISYPTNCRNVFNSKFRFVTTVEILKCAETAIVTSDDDILKVATSSMDNQLLRYGAKDHFFRATLCRMCQDTQDATNSLAKYEDMFPVFSDSRECKLLKVTCLFVLTSLLCELVLQTYIHFKSKRKT